MEIMVHMLLIVFNLQWTLNIPLNWLKNEW